jgi:hypothetical protein
MNYIDTKAKCRHLTQFTYKDTLRQVFICNISPRYTLVHAIIHTGGGGGERTREKVRGATAHKAKSKIPS